jgi:hypothetical protein
VEENLFLKNKFWNSPYKYGHAFNDEEIGFEFSWQRARAIKELLTKKRK